MSRPAEYIEADDLRVRVRPANPTGWFVSDASARAICKLEMNRMGHATVLPPSGHERRVWFAGRRWWLGRTRHDRRQTWWLRPV